MQSQTKQCGDTIITYDPAPRTGTLPGSATIRLRGGIASLHLTMTETEELSRACAWALKEAFLRGGEEATANAGDA